MPASRFTIANLQRLLAQIPTDKVTTYADLAAALGSPRAHRAAGNLLNKNPDPDTYPCFRVVKSDGSVGGFATGQADKLHRLHAAGIETRSGRIRDFAARRFVFPKK